MATTSEEVWQLLGELIEAQKQTRLDFQETDRQIEKLSKEIGRVNKQISALGGKWGRFVENMVAPACETIFLSRGIQVHRSNLNKLT